MCGSSFFKDSAAPLILVRCYLKEIQTIIYSADVLLVIDLSMFQLSSTKTTSNLVRRLYIFIIVGWTAYSAKIPQQKSSRGTIRIHTATIIEIIMKEMLIAINLSESKVFQV